MGKIFCIVKRNFHTIASNSFSYLFLFFIPLILILIIGSLYFNQNEYHFKVGYVASNETDLTKIYLDSIEQDDTFSLSKQESRDKCVDMIEDGFLHACLVFPDDFSIKEANVSVVEVVLDNTKQDILSPLQNNLYEILNENTLEYKKRYIQDLVHFLDDTYNKSNELLRLNNEIKDSVAQLDSNLENLKKDLNEYDKDFSVNELGVSSLSNKFEDILDDRKYLIMNFNNFMIDSYSSLEELDVLIDDFEDNLSEQDITKMRAKILIVEESLDGINSSLVQFDESINYNRMSDIIDDLRADLNDIEAQLDSNSDEIKSKINQNLEAQKRIDELNVEMDNISLFLKNEIDSFEIKDTQTLIEPIVFEKRDIYVEDSDQISSVVPLFISTLILVLSLFLSSSIAYRERRTPALTRNILTKTNSLEFLLGNMVTSFVVIFVQVGLILAIYSFFILEGGSLFSNILLLLASLIISIFPFIILGNFAGQIAKDENNMYLILFAIIFLFLLGSGEILPLEFLNGNVVFSYLAYVNPFMFVQAIFRKIIYFTTSFRVVLFDYLVLIGFSAVFFIISLLIESYQKKRFLFTYIENKGQYGFFNMKKKDKIEEKEKK